MDPYIRPLDDEEEEDLDVPPAEWLAGASDSLAPASHSAEQLRGRVPFPLRCLADGRTEVPDFGRIPVERWEEAMRTIPIPLREAAARGVAKTFEQTAELMALAWSDLPPTPSDVAREAVLAKPRAAATPTAGPFRRANRQVNFRLTDEEYLDLGTAAELTGTTPTHLAGMLVRNGVRRMLEEANRPDG